MITGIVVILPSVVTIWVLWGLFNFIDGLAQKIPGHLPGIPGIGVVIFLAVILCVGIFATNVIGKRIIARAENAMARIPLANKIYGAVRQMSAVVLGTDKSLFSKVVLVEYPRKGIFSIGFITTENGGEIDYRTSKQTMGVFVPTTPNPTSGLFVFVPVEELIFLDMSTEDGVKIVISGGVVNPPYPYNNKRQPSEPVSQPQNLFATEPTKASETRE